MGFIRLPLAVLIGKFVGWVSRVIGHKGSSLPGMVARKIYSRVLTDLAARLRRPHIIYKDGQEYEGIVGKIIAVTGTNGKTTVTHMLHGFLQTSSQKVVYNHDGANMVNGITAAFIDSVGVFGKTTAEFALLEIDEGSLPAIMDEITVDVLVVTNFSSDQEDRYNTATAAEIVKGALVRESDVWLVLNADDPNTAVLADTMPGQHFFYGSVTGSMNIEARFCPRCGKKLAIGVDGFPGKYACSCGFVRPDPDLYIEPLPDPVDLCCRARFSTGQEFRLCSPVLGTFNYYNMAAAFMTGICLGLDPERMMMSLKNYATSPGRMERFSHNGKFILLNLVKNAKGYTESLSVLDPLRGSVVLLLALCDTPADGCDVSWIWDVNFERLGLDANKFGCFICTGTRGAEMAVRLKYAGILERNILVVDDMRDAVLSAIERPGEHVVLLSAYSALTPLRKVLVDTTKMGGSHAEDMLSLS
ncbi:MAG: MurT ligase domain-containing protein [Peptococcaceae bacterium]|nr:MurT ligase domain-containing protein [Peptococcaceae bacterium]